MSSSIGVPVNPGPMDVETVSQSSAAGTEDVDMVNIQPEVAAGESAAGGGGGGGAGTHPPTPPVAGGAAGEGSANAVVAGDASAPEEKAEPSIPEVALVPLPPNFGEYDLATERERQAGRARAVKDGTGWVQRCGRVCGEGRGEKWEVETALRAQLHS